MLPANATSRPVTAVGLATEPNWDQTHECLLGYQRLQAIRLAFVPGLALIALIDHPSLVIFVYLALLGIGFAMPFVVATFARVAPLGKVRNSGARAWQLLIASFLVDLMAPLILIAVLNPLAFLDPDQTVGITEPGRRARECGILFLVAVSVYSVAGIAMTRAVGAVAGFIGDSASVDAARSLVRLTAVLVAAFVVIGAILHAGANVAPLLWLSLVPVFLSAAIWHVVLVRNVRKKLLRHLIARDDMGSPDALESPRDQFAAGPITVGPTAAGTKGVS